MGHSVLAEYAPILVVFSVTFIAVWVLIVLVLLLCETSYSVSVLGRSLGNRGAGNARNEERLAVSRDLAQVHEALDEVSPLQIVGGKSGLVGGGCAVCLDELVAGQIGRRLQCKHMFHARCIDRWVLQCAGRDGGGSWGGIGCPLCKSAVIGSSKRSKHGGLEEMNVVISRASEYDVVYDGTILSQSEMVEY